MSTDLTCENESCPSHRQGQGGCTCGTIEAVTDAMDHIVAGELDQALFTLYALRWTVLTRGQVPMSDEWARIADAAAGVDASVVRTVEYIEARPVINNYNLTVRREGGES